MRCRGCALANDAITTGAFSGQSRQKVRNTIALLRYFRAFLASDAKTMRDPLGERWLAGTLDRAQAREKLTGLINHAINRRAGHQSGFGMTDREIAWMRDQDRLRQIHHRIRIYQFESKECRLRFSHLLASHEDC